MALCLLIVVSAYAAEKPELNSNKERAGNEVLVASFIDNEEIGDTPSWCGNDGFMFRGDLISLKGNKGHVIRKNEKFYGCTPDGKWVLYEDESGKREYKDIWGTVPGKIIDDPYTWSTSVVDLYRYEVDTGARQKFAVVPELSRAEASPDSSKVFFTSSPEIIMDMPKPEWKVVWPVNEKVSKTWHIIYWLKDSSGVVSEIHKGGRVLGFSVEFFGEEGRTKAYSLEQLGLPPGLDGYFRLLGVDKNNRIYFLINKMNYDTDIDRNYVFRCNIKGQAISCEAQGAFDANRYISSPIVLPCGEIIFSKYIEPNDCIWRLRFGVGENKARCIVNKRYGSDSYDNIRLKNISPDGKRIVFFRTKELKKTKGKDVKYKVDIFVKDLSEN